MLGPKTHDPGWPRTHGFLLWLFWNACVFFLKVTVLPAIENPLALTRMAAKPLPEACPHPQPLAGTVKQRGSSDIGVICGLMSWTGIASSCSESSYESAYVLQRSLVSIVQVSW